MPGGSDSSDLVQDRQDRNRTVSRRCVLRWLPNEALSAFKINWSAADFQFVDNVLENQVRLAPAEFVAFLNAATDTVVH